MRISIPQPCNESWAAMTPATGGRHCAACRKTVVDFTQKSDAEILAYLARAAGPRLCGRFAAGQLERPLQRAASAAPLRWRAWLAAAVALWGLREVAGSEARAQVPTEQRAVPPGSSHLDYAARPDYEGRPTARIVRGKVVDAQTKQALAGAIVQLKGTTITATTAEDGTFTVQCPAETDWHQVIVLHYFQYPSRELLLTAGQVSGEEQLLAMEGAFSGGMVYRRAWPWRPIRFYYWAKDWLTYPFRK